MIFNFFKKDKRSELKKSLDAIDAKYIEDGGKKISDEAIRKAEETLKKVYEDGEKFELMLLKEMAEEFKKEKLIKDSAEDGSKMSDQMTLDALKSKYEAVLKDNSGQRNEDIETLIKDLGKK
jgi:hypothetical protein